MVFTKGYVYCMWLITISIEDKSTHGNWTCPTEAMSQDLMVFAFNIVSWVVKVLDTITTIHTHH